MALPLGLLGACGDGPNSPQPRVSPTSRPQHDAADDDPRKLPYLNNSTAPSIIKVTLQDWESGRRYQTLTENPLFYAFMKMHWTAISGEPGPLTLNRYATFMVAHESESIKLDLADYTDLRFLDTWVGSDHPASCLDTPYTLTALGFSSETELLEAYFEPMNGSYVLRNEGSLQGCEWERVLALLIDRGYRVNRGDVVPLIFVHRA